MWNSHVTLTIEKVGVWVKLLYSSESEKML